ncbi:DNA primase [Rhodocyclaceae bacterium]|nr:DNA primase [Rhodocyclaceae bacterium]
MARIPEAEIERLKSEVSVERLVEAAGIALKKSGKDKIGRCPFHEDDTASLVVTPAKNLWHCFGCGVGGGPIDWVMKKNGVSFRHAVELLREGVSSLAAPDTGAAGAVKRSSVRALPTPVERDADDVALLDQVTAYYHETLKRSPEALEYLRSRGLDNPDAVEHFRLGYANRTLGLRLPNKQRKEGLAIRGRLERLGVMREASGHEHLAGSLVVPILDEAGHTVNLYGRKIGERLRAGTALHLYLPERDGLNPRGVWNLAALAASREIILCEALIDALTFWCAGYRNVTTAYGAEGFSDEMLDAMKRHGTRRVLIAFDRDEAGERGAEKVAERLMAVGIECFRIQFPKGMDANEYALKVIPAQRSLGIAIRRALWMGKGAPPPAMPPADAPAAAPMPDPEPVAVAAEAAPAAPAVPPLAAEETPEPATPLADAPASPMPPVSCAEVPCEVTEAAVHFSFHDRRYRVRGLAKNAGGEVLKVNLMASRQEAFFVDSLDLYSARQRGSFVTQAALELQLTDDIVRADVGRVLRKLEDLQEAALARSLTAEEAGGVALSAEEQAEALALLRAPDLIERIGADLAACGLVGEETNKRVGYLAAVSRKLDRPLGIVIQSSSAAGKSSLMDAVLAFVPEEDQVKYSAMTGQSLFYMGETNLRHKVLALVEEEGASRASYALKLLQSEGELTIASTGKDPASGNLITQQYRVEGPVALLVTTTARDIDEELINRCLVLAVDEGRGQTRAIHRLQRERRTLEGLMAKREKESLIRLHRNAQRLLRPLDVLNPYAQYLTFPDQTTRLRRDHEKYLTLIDTIAFLHQHQREVKSCRRGERTIDYIEATLADIELANAIAHDVLGRSLDELPPQTRRLLMLIDGFVATEAERLAAKRCDVRFSRRSLREAICWGDTQLRLHLERLVDLEYVLARRDGPGGKFVYELAYAVADESRAQVAGLIDVATLEALAATPAMPKSRGVPPEVAGRLRGECGPVAGRSRDAESAADPAPARLPAELPAEPPQTHVYKNNDKTASYPHLPLAACPAR